MNRFGLRIGRLIHTLLWPALWVYLRVGARTRVLVIAEDKILLVEGWLDDGRFGLPGGGLHRTERPAVGATRELSEETGLVVLPDELRGLSSEQWNENGLSFYCHFFSLRLERIAGLTLERHEIARAEWIPVAELRQTPHKKEVDRALQLLAQA